MNHFTLDSSLTTKKLRDYREYYLLNEQFEKILDEVDHKDIAKYTTTRHFKRDILENFMNDEYKNKICLELGTSQGKSTRILSYIFKKVISIEIDDWNIEQALITCNGRENVDIRKFNLYEDVWNFPKEIEVVFIDANHTYEGVTSDILNCINNFNDPILILDDYGHPNCGIKRVIDQLVVENKLKIIKKIGQPELIHASGYINIDVEGVICRKL